MLIAITCGAHWRNTVDDLSEATQYAHIFDPESPEDIQHQAGNFLAYARALGFLADPIVLLDPQDPAPDWVPWHLEPAARHYGPEDAHIAIMKAEWAQLVHCASGRTVEIR